MIVVSHVSLEFIREESELIELGLTSLEKYPADLTLYKIFTDIIPIFALAAAIFYYVYISKSQNKTRKAQLFMQIYEHYHDIEFLKKNIEIMNMEWVDFNDFWEKYGIVGNPEATSLIFSVGMYFEGIGVMVNEKLIDITLVNDLMSGLIIRYWEKLEPIIKQQRVLFNWPEAFEWTEYLYEKITSINK